MKPATLTVGLLLVVLGVGGYWGTGAVSATALIPAPFGAALIALGLAWDRGALYRILAAGLSLLGFFGSVPGLIKLAAILSGAPRPDSAAPYIQAVMALACGIYVIFALRTVLTKQLPGGSEDPSASEVS